MYQLFLNKITQELSLPEHFKNWRIMGTKFDLYHI